MSVLIRSALVQLSREQVELALGVVDHPVYQMYCPETEEVYEEFTAFADADDALKGYEEIRQDWSDDPSDLGPNRLSIRLKEFGDPDPMDF